jgi:hypothetical protein
LYIRAGTPAATNILDNKKLAKGRDYFDTQGSLMTFLVGQAKKRSFELPGGEKATNVCVLKKRTDSITGLNSDNDDGPYMLPAPKHVDDRHANERREAQDTEDNYEQLILSNGSETPSVEHEQKPIFVPSDVNEEVESDDLDANMDIQVPVEESKTVVYNESAAKDEALENQFKTLLKEEDCPLGSVLPLLVAYNWTYSNLPSKKYQHLELSPGATTVYFHPSFKNNELAVKNETYFSNDNSLLTFLRVHYNLIDNPNYDSVKLAKTRGKRGRGRPSNKELSDSVAVTTSSKTSSVGKSADAGSRKREMSPLPVCGTPPPLSKKLKSTPVANGSPVGSPSSPTAKL